MNLTTLRRLLCATALATLAAGGADAAPIASGSYVGNGVDNRAVSGIGFAPDVVFIRSAASGPLVVRTSTIGGDKSKVLALGDLWAKMIVQLDPDGFTFGDDPAVNATGTTYHWTALGTAAQQLAVGTYDGTGTDGTPIDVGFQPEYVLVLGEDAASESSQRFSAQSGTGSLGFLGAGEQPGDITGITGTGFRVGTSAHVNNPGWHYHYVALGSTGGSVVTGSYLGDGVAGRAIDAGGLPPQMLLLARREAGSPPLFRSASVPAPLSLPATAGPALTDGVTGFTPTGFQLGGHAGANAPGSTYFWLGIRDPAMVPAIADLGVTCSVVDATPTEGEIAEFTIRVDNLGPGAVSGLALDCPLPAGLAFAPSVSTHGTYSSATGVWTVDTLAAGSSATLTLRGTALAGTAGSTQPLIARIVASNATDPAPANDEATASLVVWRPGVRVASGSYVGNGAAGRVIPVGAAFQPDLVLVKATTTVGATLRTRTMTGNGSKDMFGATALATNRIQSLSPGGFTIGSDPTVNQNGVTYYWTAVLEAPGQMVTGSYIGDGVDNRNLTGLGFQPAYVMVLSAGPRTPYHRFVDEAGDASLPFAAAAEAADHIQSLGADGFQIGASANVNAAGVVHHYVAMSAVAGVIAGGSFIGNATDNRDITSPGFRPEFVLLQRPTRSPIERPYAVAGDLTLPFVASASFANGVQSFLANGFQVGNDAWVNVSGNRTNFITLRSATTDLALAATVDDSVPDVGQSIQLSLRLRNLGPLDADGIEVEDVLPAGVTFEGAAASQGAYATGTGRWSVGALAAGDSASLTLTALIGPAAGGTVFVNRARIVETSVSDPVAANDSAAVSFRVPLADLRVRAAVDDASPTEGEDVTFSVTVTNLGPDSSTAVQIRATLPPELAFLAAGTSQGSYQSATRTWTAGAIAPGGSASLALRVEPAPGTAGAAVWCAARVLAAATFDPSAANDADSARVIVQAGEFRVVTGSYIGNGTAGRPVVGLGFQPDLLVIRGGNASATVAATKTMIGGGSKELGAASGIATGRVQSLDADGFTLGSNAAVNAPGVAYYWTAFLEAPGQMKVSSYIGNGADNRNITGLGFAPAYVMVLGSGAQEPRQRFASESGDASLPFAAGNEQNDRIQGFLADGFQVGTRAEVNAGGTVFHFVAWSAASSRIGSGAYTGDDADDRAMSVGFRPGHLLVKREDSEAAAFRPGALEGDLTLPAINAAPYANGIQALAQDGFQLGTDTAVNQDGRTYHWVGFSDVTTVGVGVRVVAVDSVVQAGQTGRIHVRAFNHGPRGATGITVAVSLPAGLARQSHAAGAGTFAPATGLWQIPALAAGDSVTLEIVAAAGPGVCGPQTVDGKLVDVDQGDATVDDNASSASVRVPCADVDVAVAADFPTRNEGDPVTIVVRARNDGPDPATNVVVSNQLPSGLTWTGTTPEQGTFSLATGIWFTGALASGDSARLVLSATVDGGTGGSTLRHIATIDAEENDPTAADRADTAAIYIATGAGIDLLASHPASRAVPGEAGVPVLDLTVLNSGVESRTLDRIELTNRTRGPASQAQLDAELGAVRMTADAGGAPFGTFTAEPVTGGVVAFGGLSLAIAPGSYVHLRVQTTVPMAAADGDSLDLSLDDPSRLVFDLPVNYSAPWPVNPPGAVLVDGMIAAQLSVRTVTEDTIEIGAVRALVFDLLLPSNGYQADVLTGLRVANSGTAVDGADVRRVELWADGGDGTFTGDGDDTLLGDLAWDGSAWGASGLTFAIPAPGRRVFVTADAAETATIGHTVVAAVPVNGIAMASGNDGPIDAAVGSGQTLKLRGHDTAVELWASPQTQSALLPGRAGVEVFRLQLLNQAAAPEMLQELTLTNTTIGPGTTTERDAEWQRLHLLRGTTELATAAFSGGRATFTGLGLALAQGDTVALRVVSGASLAARDGDLLDLAVAGVGDVVFTKSLNAIVAGTLDPGGAFAVDGMSLAQVDVSGATAGTVLIGSSRNLVLDVRVPANGYEPDTLRFLMLRNAGTAAAVTDIARMEAWADDGDGVFEPAAGDALVGSLIYTNGTWILIGFDLPIPVGGQRVFVTADVEPRAVEGRTVRMLVTSSPVRGLNMASANDGPVDGEPGAPMTAVISAQDRILVSTDNPAGGTAGAADSIGLMRLVVRSTYTDSSRTLTQITLANTTHGAGGTQANRDAELQLIHLHDGGPTGPHLATAFFNGGRAVFSDFAWSVAPGEQRVLFIDGDLSSQVADGDVLEAEVSNDAGLSFWVPVSMAATFPLTSAAWTVDGMRASQIDVPGARPAALGPDDGPALALDFVVPRNGYRDDVLEGVRLENAGTADPSQIREVRLWSDGGNGTWDAGGGDDADLGAMTWIGSRWVSSALSDAISAAGLRLFATIATGSTIVDSASVRLRLPVNGLTVQSGNDGPVDLPVTNPAAVLLSTSHLLATFDIDAPATVLGDTVFARLSVRNTGGVPILGIAPAVPVTGGSGTVSLLGGPSPASMDLAAGALGTFTWMYLAQATGTVTFSSSAQGAEQGSGTTVRSLKVTTAAADLLTPVADVRLYATESLPFSISRGQIQVVPLTLTLSNPGGDDGSDALVRRVTIRIEDEFGGPVVPADLLKRVMISEGANVYAEVGTPPLAGSTVDLAFARPVRIESSGSGGQVTLSLSLDISDTTRVSSFRIVVDGPASFAAEDATSAGAVPVVLTPPLSYPVRSGLARISAGGTELDIAGVADPPRAIGRGQAAVELAHLTLLNPGPVVYGPDVRLSVVAVSLVDSAGAIVPRPADYLTRIRVTAPPLTLLDRAVGGAEDSVLMLAITPSLSLPINTPVAVTISGDLAATGPLGAFHLVLADTSLFVARNASTGARLPVLTTPDPVTGVPLTVQAQADTVLAGATPALPETLAVGAVNVTAMTLRLRHPGDGTMGAIRIDRLVLRCRDPFNAPLPPAIYLDAVRARVGGTEVGSLTSLPATGSEFAIPLTGVAIAPGAHVDLEVVLDVEITAPIEAFAVTFGEDGADAIDANLGTPVAVAPDLGADFPLTSGIARLEAPPRELAVAFAESMPAALAADGSEFPAGRLTLRNTAASGEIRLDHLEVLAGDAGYASLALGGLATKVRAYVADTLWAETPDLTPAASTGVLTAAAPLAVRAGEPVAVDLRFVPAATAGETGFRLGLSSGGIGVVQPGGTLFTVAIVAESGLSFPFWTQVGSLSGTTLPSSYSNFPNPFAAGRDRSRFVYYLRTSGRVTLRLWTARGEAVCTLLDGVAQPAGLRQDAWWDGRNGLGGVVVNGAYVAEIVVAYDDGTTERALRKVAVVR